MTTHAFTCTGPYALLTMPGIKRVENRSATSSRAPSGRRSRRRTTPSVQDRHLTTELTRLGDALGVKVLDHLVLT